jgi:hypothetical protein
MNRLQDIQAMTLVREALENSASDLRRESYRHKVRAKACEDAAAEAQNAADAFDKHICAAIDAQNLKVTT